MRADARRYPGQVYDLTFVEQFSYTQAGLPTKKLWTMTKPFTGTGSLEALYSYDKGRRTEMTYPTALGPGGVEPGRVFAYQYDTMGRPSGMTQDVWTTWVSGITYNPAGQMTAMSYVNGGESRTYNTLGQMTNLVSGNVNLEYRFHATVGKVYQSGSVSSECGGLQAAAYRSVVPPAEMLARRPIWAFARSSSLPL